MNDIQDSGIPPDDNFSHKKRKKTKKIKNTASHISQQQSMTLPVLPPPTEQEKIMLDTLVQELNKKIGNIIEDNQNNKPKRPLELDQLQNLLKEYMNTFLLLGYNIEGEPFVLSYAKNVQDHNSIVEHLRLTFLNTFKSPLF
jgi:hypothetical protein